jgi:hypothetical protein
MVWEAKLFFENQIKIKTKKVKVPKRSQYKIRGDYIRITSHKHPLKCGTPPVDALNTPKCDRHDIGSKNR